MKQGLVWTAKMVAVWLALLAGNIAGAMLVTLPGTPGGDGPLDLGQAFLLVHVLFAMVLASVAARLTGGFARRALILFALLYLVETLLSTAESLFFASFLHLPDGLLAGLAAINGIKAALAAAVAAWLWRVEGGPNVLRGLAWKLPALIPLYILLYFGAGQFIAWQSAAVRDYYGQGLAIDTGALLLFQVGRGAVWAGLAWLLARGLAGPPLVRALRTGAAFAVLMAGPLLYPNALMPWPVRQVHLLELVVSNFLFGLLAVLLLSGLVDRKNQEADRDKAATRAG